MHIDYSAQPETSPQSQQPSHPAYAALAEQYEDVDRRIARIENGIERPDGVPVTALKLGAPGCKKISHGRCARHRATAATAASNAAAEAIRRAAASAGLV